MRVGLVCPYPWDVPGGVMAHVRDLAVALRRLGHEPSVIAPVDDENTELPPYLVAAGRSVPIPFNGSVARLAFGPLSAARVRRWLHDGHFDVLHVHSPEAPSLSMLAVMLAKGPIVATFHASNPRSRVYSAVQPALQTQMEKIDGRIAVSPAARKTIVEHLGGDAVVIPNGVDVSHFAGAMPLTGYPRRGGTLGFLGRIDEPRKGLPVLTEAFELLSRDWPDLQLLVAGPGDTDEVRDSMPAGLRDRVRLLGLISESDKASFFASIQAYVAPNTGGESFGIILLEAMAGSAPIIASDLEAFRRVLDNGRAGLLFDVGDAAGLAAAAGRLLRDRELPRRLTLAGYQVVRAYDWSSVAAQVVRVYETVTAGAPGGVSDTDPTDPSADPVPGADPNGRSVVAP